MSNLSREAEIALIALSIYDDMKQEAMSELYRNKLVDIWGGLTPAGRELLDGKRIVIVLRSA